MTDHRPPHSAPGAPNRGTAPTGHAAPHAAPHGASTHTAPHGVPGHAPPHAQPSHAAPHGGLGKGGHLDDDGDGPKKRVKKSWLHWPRTIMAHPVAWGATSVAVLALLCGFLGASLALSMNGPVEPKMPLAPRLTPERAAQCETIETRFSRSGEMVERNMMERLHQRLGCDPVKLAEHLRN